MQNKHVFKQGMIMSILFETIRQHMGIVYFFYGTSFFIFGSVIIVQCDASCKYVLGRYFWLLGVFGILHGFNEWIDMLIFYKTSAWIPNVLILVNYIKNILFTFTSFIFLLQFGLWGLTLLNEKKVNRIIAKGLLWASIIFVSLVILLPIVKTDFLSARSIAEMISGEIFVRYLLAFPGALLTGIVFFAWRKKIMAQEQHSKLISISFIALGISFILYAVFAGLIVPQSDFFPASVINYLTFLNIVGLPVQVFRMFCALIVSIFIFSLLHIFSVEKTQDSVPEGQS